MLQNRGMVEYRKNAHAVFDIKYHVVWITKYRYKVLKGRVAERARDLIRQICQARDVVIREYIESQKWDEDDQGFKIVGAPTEP